MEKFNRKFIEVLRKHGLLDIPILLTAPTRIHVDNMGTALTGNVTFEGPAKRTQDGIVWIMYRSYKRYARYEGEGADEGEPYIFFYIPGKKGPLNIDIGEILGRHRAGEIRRDRIPKGRRELKVEDLKSEEWAALDTDTRNRQLAAYREMMEFERKGQSKGDDREDLRDIERELADTRKDFYPGIWMKSKEAQPPQLPPGGRRDNETAGDWGWIEGRITDENNVPIHNASVSIGPGMTSYTRDNGYYRLPEADRQWLINMPRGYLPSGKYNVTCYAAGFIGEVISVDVPRGRVVIDFVLRKAPPFGPEPPTQTPTGPEGPHPTGPPTGGGDGTGATPGNHYFWGKVRSFSGRRISGIKVILANTGEEAVTGENGEYRLPATGGVGPGNYTIHCDDTRVHLNTATIEIFPGIGRPPEGILYNSAAGSEEYHVRIDPGLHRLPRIEISFQLDERLPSRGGQPALPPGKEPPALPPGEELLALPPGRPPGRPPEGVGDANAWIHGHVKNKYGKPIGGANVVIADPFRNEVVRGMSHDNGYYIIPIVFPLGAYADPGSRGSVTIEVTCNATGYVPEEAEMRVRYGDNRHDFTLQRPPVSTEHHIGRGIVYGQVWRKNAQGKDEPYSPFFAGEKEERVGSGYVYLYPFRFLRNIPARLGTLISIPLGTDRPEEIADTEILSAEIDKFGRYIITNIPPGDYDIVCNVTDERQDLEKEKNWPSTAHHTPPDSRYPTKGTDNEALRRGNLPFTTTARVHVSADTRLKHDFHFYPHGGSYFARGANTARNWIEHRWGAGVLGNILPLALTTIGFIISNNYHNTNFLLGFLSLAVYFLLPEPIAGRLAQEIAGGHIQLQVRWKDFVRRGENREQFNNAWRWLIGNNNSAWSLLRAAAKTTAIWFFAQGLIQSTFPFAGLLLFVLAFVGYFSLPIEYDARGNSGQFLESVIRFGILGAYIIPWVIFAQIFDSLVLGLVAFAFFAVPPVPKQEQQSNVAVFSSLALMEKFFFLFVMFLALTWSGALVSVFPGLAGLPLFSPPAGWNLKGALADTFFFFWIVYTVAGFFAPAQERPAAGFIMLGASTVIYAIGPGTQEVGQGLLGPYFPAFYKGVIGFAKPFSTAFSGIGTAFGPALGLLFNPVGYAQNITQGIYGSADPQSGITGAFGVEIDDFKAATQIYTEQPYVLSLKLNNMGSFNARKVMVSLAAGEKAPEIEKYGSFWATLWSAPNDPKNIRERINLADLGFSETKGEENGIEELKCEGPSGKPLMCSRDITSSMGKLMILPVFFQTDKSGITCKTVNRYELKEKFLPFAAIVAYDYDIASILDIEFMSDAEWRRKAEADELVLLQRRPSTLSNAPVMLNIDTTEQPIKEDIPYGIRIQLAAGPRGGTINTTYSINAEIPTEMWKYRRYCVPYPKVKEIKAKNVTLLTWKEDVIPPSLTVICSFNHYKFPSEEKKGTAPTKTFLVKANASYRFFKGTEAIEKMEWGGPPCCYPEGKYKGQRGDEYCRGFPGYTKCDKDTQQCISQEFIEPAEDELGGSKFCSTQSSVCVEHFGGCEKNEECIGNAGECRNLGDIEFTVLGRKYSIGNAKACCLPEKEGYDCKDFYVKTLQLEYCKQLTNDEEMCRKELNILDEAGH